MASPALTKKSDPARITDDTIVTLAPAASASRDSRLDPKLIVEAALFSAGKPLSVEEIAENTAMQKRQVDKGLAALAEHYKNLDSSLEVGQAGRKWALQVRALYAPRTTRLAPMEVSIKTLKTLALIAYHQPLLQSDLMDMVGAKVYDHVKELAALGLVRKRSHERSYMLVTTERFPEYFGIAATDREELKRYLARKVGLKLPETDGKGNRKLSSMGAEEPAPEQTAPLPDAVAETSDVDESPDGALSLPESASLPDSSVAAPVE